MPLERKQPVIKRKRAKEEDPSTKLSGKLHHCAKEVKKAAKKAKDFEIRKLVKRLKGLRAKEDTPPELKDLEEQLSLLKEIDHETVANTALRTKLKKDKKLSENTDLETVIAKELALLVVPASPGSNLAKVQGRLLSSKVVATEVHSVVESIRAVVFPEPKQPAAEEQHSDDESEEEEVERPTKKVKLARADASDDEESDEESDGEGALGEQTVLDEDDEGVDDGGWESGSVNSGPDISDDEEDDEGSEGENNDSDDSDEEAEEPVARKAKSAPAKASATKASGKAGQSTFLPSLSVGFTRGDSDASDIDDGEVAKTDVVKKNRRGQRARQAIWEKKYGKNANHVKKQVAAGPKDPRNAFKRPGGRPQGNGRPYAQGNARPYSQNSQGHAPRPQEPPLHPSVPIRLPARTVEEKPLHPSWEAKRKLKEKQSATIVAPKGKKIVF